MPPVASPTWENYCAGHVECESGCVFVCLTNNKGGRDGPVTGMSLRTKLMSLSVFAVAAFWVLTVHRFAQCRPRAADLRDRQQKLRNLVRVIMPQPLATSKEGQRGPDVDGRCEGDRVWSRRDPAYDKDEYFWISDYPSDMMVFLPIKPALDGNESGVS